MSVIYRKTEKGAAEIETRVYRLSPRLRQALILVDGRKTDVELSKFVGADYLTVFDGLLAEGFIDVFATLADGDRKEPPKPRAPDPALDETIPLLPRVPRLDQLRRDAQRFLVEQMGPAATEHSLQMERAKSVPELQTLLTQIALSLRDARGPEVADEFIRRYAQTNAA